MSDGFDAFVADMRLRGLTPATQQGYLACVRRCARFHHSDTPPVDSDAIRAFLRQLGPRYHPRTVAAHMAALAFYFRYTLRRPDVMQTLPRPRVKRPAPRVPPTRAELTALFAATARPFDRTLFRLLYATGLRLAEARHAQAPDLDPVGHLLTVRAAKGGRTRAVPLHPPTLALLRDHWRRERLPGPWLFPSRPLGHIEPGHLGSGWADRPVRADAVRRRLGHAVRAAGLTRSLTPHDLRRAHATHLYEAGVDLRVLQTLLGHQDLQTVQQYVQVSERRLGGVPCLLAHP